MMSPRRYSFARAYYKSSAHYGVSRAVFGKPGSLA